MTAALLLIDIQNDYFPGGRMELAGAEEAGAVSGRALGLFRGRGLPVFHIRHESVREGAAFFLPGTGGADIHPLVAPLPGEAVITKRFPNGFRETPLLEKLRAAGVTRLLVAGMMTHMCVDAGVRAAVDLGFGCAVLAGGTATRDLVFGGETVPAHRVQGAFLAALGSAYCPVLDEDGLDGWLDG